jgi:hypothetical protein
MSITNLNAEIRVALDEFDRRIEEMHNEFQKYRYDEAPKMPDWEKLDRELLVYSRRRILDLNLSKQLDRILFKFQNRKRIWLSWIEEKQGS